MQTYLCKIAGFYTQLFYMKSSNSNKSMISLFIQISLLIAFQCLNLMNNLKLYNDEKLLFLQSKL